MTTATTCPTGSDNIELTTPTAGPDASLCSTGAFVPLVPETLEEAELTQAEFETLMMRFLLNVGQVSGRQVADQVRLPFGIVHDGLQRLKSELLVGYKGSAGLNDYTYELTETGFERARRF